MTNTPPLVMCVFQCMAEGRGRPAGGQRHTQVGHRCQPHRRDRGGTPGAVMCCPHNTHPLPPPPPGCTHLIAPHVKQTRGENFYTVPDLFFGNKNMLQICMEYALVQLDFHIYRSTLAIFKWSATPCWWAICLNLSSSFT